MLLFWRQGGSSWRRSRLEKFLLYFALPGSVYTKFGTDPTGKLLTYDALTNNFHTVKLQKRVPSCAVCGDHPTITELIDYEQAECPDHI